MLLARGLIQLKLVPFEAAPAHHCTPSGRLGNCLFRFWIPTARPLAHALLPPAFPASGSSTQLTLVGSGQGG